MRHGYLILQKAISLAVKEHYGQSRFNGEPFILHPMRVMMAMENTKDKIVAILHDVVEDTCVSLEDISHRVCDDQPILTALECLSHGKDEDYQNYLERVSLSPLATRVKLADLRDNLKILDLPEVSDRDTKRIKKHYEAYRLLSAIEQIF